MFLHRLKQFYIIAMVLFVSSCTNTSHEKAKDIQVIDDNVKHSIDDNAYTSLSLMMHVMQMIHENYVDADDATYQKLIDNALRGMVHGLDPYSQYYEPEIYEEVEKDNSGQFGGIGVVLRMADTGLLMMKVNNGGPADKSGIKKGDVIVEIESEKVMDMDLKDALNCLKGEPGTDVEVKVFRASDKSEHNMLITREIIKISPVSGTKLIEDKIGYVKLSQFTRPTVEKLDEALIKLKEQGMNALIFDLRNNPGGFVASAVDVCSRFIEKDKLVVFTKGREGAKKNVFNSKECGVRVCSIPMVILINEMSASASEIVSGCLKDYKRAVLVGEKSYGKGSVQTVVKLSNSGAAKFTIAKYYTPNAYVIHGAGIEPDIKVSVPEKDKHRLAVQISRFPGVVKPKGDKNLRDIQLERAIEVLKGVLIYKKSGL